MSFLTWCGAAIGCALAHFQIYIVNVDVSSLNNVKRPFFDLIRPVFANKIISGPLHNFACTLFGALLGLLTEMTYNVSFPSLFMFLLSSLITNRNKIFSLRSVSESESAKDNLNTAAPVAPQTTSDAEALGEDLNEAIGEDLNQGEALFLPDHHQPKPGDEGQVTDTDTNVTDEGTDVTDKERGTADTNATDKERGTADTNAKEATRNLLRRRQ
jgi:hypothetical protein